MNTLTTNHTGPNSFIASPEMRRHEVLEQIWQYEAELENLPNQWAKFGTSLHTLHEQRLQEDPTPETLRRSAKSIRSFLADASDEIAQTTFNLTAKRAELYTSLVPIDELPRLKSTLAKAEKYGPNHHYTNLVLEGSDPQTKHAIQASLDVIRLERTLRQAKTYGPNHRFSQEEMNSMHPSVLHATDTTLDRLRLKRGLKDAETYGPDHRYAKDELRGLQPSVGSAFNASLDSVRMKNAAKKAETFGPEHRYTHEKMEGITSPQARSIIQKKVGQKEPKANADAINNSKSKGYQVLTTESALNVLVRERNRRSAWRERLPRRRVSTTLAAAGLALAGFMGRSEVIDALGLSKPNITTSANPAPTPEKNPTTPEATPTPSQSESVEMSRSGICIGPEAAQLLITDCRLLPNVTEGASFDVLENTAAESEVTTGPIGDIIDGRLYAPEMSQDYKQALEAALSDPLNAAMQKDVDVRLEQTPDIGKVNGWYSPDTRNIRLIFYTLDQTNDTDRLFRTWGSLRYVLIHENTHALYDRWVSKASVDIDGTTNQTLQEMDKLCLGEVSVWLGNFYDKNADQIDDWLDNISMTVKKLQSDSVIDATKAKQFNEGIRRTRNEVSTKAGFIKFSTSAQTGTPECRVDNKDMPLLIGLQKNMRAEKMYDYLEDEKYNNDFAELVRMDESLMSSMLDDSVALRESGILKGLGNGGHPFNVTEQVATTITAIQMNPDGFTKALLDLPANRLENRRQFITLIYKLIKQENPELADKTNIPAVLKVLNKHTR